MKNVDRIRQTSHVDHPKSTGVVPYPDFFNALANRRHRLKVVGLLAVLHPVKLAAGILPRIVRKRAQALERIAEESYWLHWIKYTDIDIFWQGENNPGQRILNPILRQPFRVGCARPACVGKVLPTLLHPSVGREHFPAVY